MHTTRRSRPIRRRAALATAIVTALAIVAPVAEASAQPSVLIPVPTVAAGFIAPILAYAGTYGGNVAAAGPAINDVINGGTTVVVGTYGAYGSTNASP